MNASLERRMRVAADAVYANSTVLGGLPSNIVFIGTMRPDAALTALPDPKDQPPTGRRRKRGERLPKPSELAKSPRHRWSTLDVHIYGRDVTLAVKVFDAQWYRVARDRHLRVVLVRVLRGDLPVRVFFCTDPKLGVEDIIKTYASRWGIEVCFRELKQHLGFGDSPARKREAVERTAPFAGYYILCSCCGSARCPRASVDEQSSTTLGTAPRRATPSVTDPRKTTACEP